MRSTFAWLKLAIRKPFFAASTNGIQRILCSEKSGCLVVKIASSRWASSRRPLQLQGADLQEPCVEIAWRKVERAVSDGDCRRPILDEAIGGGGFFCQIVETIKVERAQPLGVQEERDRAGRIAEQQARAAHRRAGEGKARIDVDRLGQVLGRRRRLAAHDVGHAEIGVRPGRRGCPSTAPCVRTHRPCPGRRCRRSAAMPARSTTMPARSARRWNSDLRDGPCRRIPARFRYRCACACSCASGRAVPVARSRGSPTAPGKCAPARPGRPPCRGSTRSRCQPGRARLKMSTRSRSKRCDQTRRPFEVSVSEALRQICPPLRASVPLTM